MLALHVAHGDMTEAERLLDWAYNNPNTGDGESYVEDDKRSNNKATDAFIRRYLGGRVTPNKILMFTKRYLEVGETRKDYPAPDFAKVCDHIKSMPYQVFLATTYWAAIAGFVKRRQGSRCQICGSTKLLDVHHRTYRNHGDELHNTDDLVCLCHDCHTKTHDKNQ